MTDETLITETPAVADDAAPAITTVDEQAAAPEPEVKTEGDAPVEEAKTEETKADERPGAPEAYEDFAMPEGVTIDPEVAGDLKALAKDLDLPQEAAQKVADLGAKMAQKWADRQTAVLTEAAETWAGQVHADKELGGDEKRVSENLAVAKSALDKFGSPELTKLLNESKFGNHPEVIRAFYRIGKAISDDKPVPATGGLTPFQDTAKSLYPNHS